MAPMPNFLQQAAQATGGGVSYVKFDDNSRGVPVTIEIDDYYRIREYKYEKQTVYYQKGPNAGKPKYEMLINGQVNGEKMIMATGAKYRLENAIAKAVIDSGAEDLEFGGKLTVTYVSKEAVKGAGSAMVFEVSYERGEGGSAYNAAFDESVNPPAPEPAFTPGAGGGFGGGQQGGGAPAGFPGAQSSGAPSGFPGAR